MSKAASEDDNEHYYISKFKDLVLKFCIEQQQIISVQRTFKFSEIKEKFMTVTDLNLKAVLNTLVAENKLQASGGRAVTYTLVDVATAEVNKSMAAKVETKKPLNAVATLQESNKEGEEKVKLFPIPVLAAANKKRPHESPMVTRKSLHNPKDRENVAAPVNYITEIRTHEALVQKYALSTYECATILPVLRQAFAVSEGVIPVEDFRILLLSRSTLDVPGQFNSILRYLEDQNKIMVSDGNIYEI